jgi:2-hydroxy-6-oxonona-2,4-dienedioate hydrolase
MKQRTLWALSAATVAGGAALGGLARYVYRQPEKAAQRAAGLALRMRGAASRLVMVDGYIVHYYTTGPKKSSSAELPAPALQTGPCPGPDDRFRFHPDPCPTTRSPSPQRGGGRGERSGWGGGPPAPVSALVLLHGIGDSAATWWQALPRLARAFPQARIVAPDLPGFGISEMRPDGGTIDDYVTFLIHFLDALGIERAALIGNSLGGWIATRAAARHPERVTRLITINSGGIFHGQEVRWMPRTRAEARDFVARVVGRPLLVPDFACDAIIRSVQKPAFQRFLARYDPARDDLDGDLARVQAPTTIIWGMADRLLPAEAPDWFATGIPHARLVRLPDVGHSAQMTVPALLADVIRHIW